MSSEVPSLILSNREAEREALTKSPTVVDVNLKEGVAVALRGLSLTVCAVAATCDDPPDVLRKFADYLPLDLDVVLKGSSEGDSPHRVTLSDLMWTRQ